MFLPNLSFQNQSKEDGFETKIEDLEGYWAMVSYQVDDVNQTFDDINLLRKNNWEISPSDQPPVSRESGKSD